MRSGRAGQRELILLVESLGVGPAVRIKELLAALLPCNLERWHGDVPIRGKSRSGRRADKTPEAVKQWRTLSLCNRYSSCKTKNTHTQIRSAERNLLHDGIADTLVSVRTSCSADELAQPLRSCGPNRREGADIRGSFPRPRTSRTCAFRRPTASLALRHSTFARQGRRRLASCFFRHASSNALMHFMNFIGREYAIVLGS